MENIPFEPIRVGAGNPREQKLLLIWTSSLTIEMVLSHDLSFSLIVPRAMAEVKEVLCIRFSPSFPFGYIVHLRKNI